MTSPAGDQNRDGEISDRHPQHQNEELAALLAAGALPSHEEELARTQAAAWEFLSVAAVLAESFPKVDPPAHVKEQLLAQLPPQSHSPTTQAEQAPALTFQFAKDEPFLPTPYPLLSARILHIDRTRKQFSALLRLEPGGSYPSHSHDGPEECLVLEGELLVGDVLMRAGDFQRAEAGTAHIEQLSPRGALLFITAPIGLLGD